MGINLKKSIEFTHGWASPYAICYTERNVRIGKRNTIGANWISTLLIDYIPYSRDSRNSELKCSRCSIKGTWDNKISYLYFGIWLRFKYIQRAYGVSHKK